MERSRKASTGRLGLLSIGTVPWVLEQLAAEPFVSLRQAFHPELVAEQMAPFREHGVAPPAAQEAADPISLLSLIAAGAGVSMHVSSFANLRRKGVAFIPLAGEAPTATLFALTRRDDDRPLVRAFVEAARASARSLESPDIPSSPVR